MSERDHSISGRDHIVLAYQAPPAVRERAAQLFSCHGGDSDLSVAEAVELARVHQARGLVISGRHRFTAAALATLPKTVRILASASAGYDHVDLPAAKQLGLRVSNTPDALTDCTADMAMLLMLAACRRAREYLAIMEAGWGRSYSQCELLGTGLSGKTLGILGMGRIGRAVAHRAQAFGMKVAYHNSHQLPPEQAGGATFYADLADLLKVAQILSLHAPATPATRQVINSTTLALLPVGAVLINTARGSLVDEEALIAALRSGHLAAAGLDVYATEPQVPAALRDLPQVFLTPHTGSATVETRNAMGFQALRNAAAVLKGEPPLDPVV